MSQFPRDHSYISPFAGVTGIEMLEKDPTKMTEEQREAAELAQKKVAFLKTCFMESEKRTDNLEVVKEEVCVKPRKMQANWHVEDVPESFTVVCDEDGDEEWNELPGLDCFSKEETDEERYDRVMNALLEDPLA